MGKTNGCDRQWPCTIYLPFLEMLQSMEKEKEAELEHAKSEIFTQVGHQTLDSLLNAPTTELSQLHNSENLLLSSCQNDAKKQTLPPPASPPEVKPHVQEVQVEFIRCCQCSDVSYATECIIELGHCFIS